MRRAIYLPRFANNRDGRLIIKTMPNKSKEAVQTNWFLVGSGSLYKLKIRTGSEAVGANTLAAQS
jgi:hypothetical protein